MCFSRFIILQSVVTRYLFVQKVVNCYFINTGVLFGSELIRWSIIYLIVGYMKKYMEGYCNNVKINIAGVAIGIIVLYGLVFITNVLGFHINWFHDKMLYWWGSQNPFLFLFCISLLNIVRKVEWKNRLINYISKLSLLIYIIHENAILRAVYRKKMWNYIYINWGYAHVIEWDLICSILIFCGAIIFSILYKNTLQKLVYKFSAPLYDLIKRIYISLENKMIKIS